MDSSLYETIKAIQSGDCEKIADVINIFRPTINKFSRKLKYEEAETDLIIAFIEMLKAMNLKKFDSNNEGAIVNYIYSTMKNKHVDLFRRYVKRQKEEFEINLDIIVNIEKYSIESGAFIEDLLNRLPEMQKMILKEKYIKDHTDIEIAEKLHITRQAVNKSKNRGLKTLREYLDINFNVA